MNTQQDEITGCIIRSRFCLLCCLASISLSVHACGISRPLPIRCVYLVVLSAGEVSATTWIQKRGCPEKEICMWLCVNRPRKKGVGKLLMRAIAWKGRLRVFCKNAFGWVCVCVGVFISRAVSLTTTAAAVSSGIGHVLHKLWVVYDSNSNFHNFQPTQANGFLQFLVILIRTLWGRLKCY